MRKQMKTKMKKTRIEISSLFSCLLDEDILRRYIHH